MKSIYCKTTIKSAAKLLAVSALVFFSTESKAQLALTLSKTNVNCNGNNNGAVNLTVANGVSPVIYLWSNGTTDEDLTNLAPGMYTVVVADSIGSTATDSVVITEPAILAVTVVPQPAPCGSNIGFATANPTGGTPKKIPSNPTYTYLWSTGQTLKSIGGLYPGSYTVTVTDSLGCIATQTTTILNTAITSIETATTKAKCSLNNGTACVVGITGGVGPFTYQWDTDPVQTSSCATGLANGKYEVVIGSSDGCIYIQSNIKVYKAIPPVVTTTNNNCNSAIAVPVVALKPATYLWSNGATTKKATSLTSGDTYTVTITDLNGCTASSSIILCAPSKMQMDGHASTEQNLNVLPNPADMMITFILESSSSQIASISIIDLTGKVVLEEMQPVVAGKNSLEFNIADLPSGIYSVSVLTDKHLITEKFVKQ